MKNFHCLRVGFYPAARFNYGVASGVDTGPCSGRHTREHRDTVSRAFLRLDSLDFVSVNIRLDLPPQRGTRAAAAETNRFTRYVQLFQDLKRIFETESDAFENCANNVCARVTRG